MGAADTSGVQKYSGIWFIYGNRKTKSQAMKYTCKQLNLNKTLNGLWPTAVLLCAHKGG